MSDKTFDLVIIGGGAAGLFAASVGKALGAKVCIIEKDKLGGDCTWYGCVPSKTLLKSAQTAHAVRTAAAHGLQTGVSRVGTQRVMDHVRGIVGEVAAHERPEDLEERGISVILGAPRFTGRNALEVKGETVYFKKAVICTGSHPRIPQIDGLDEVGYLTNETVFDLQELPASLIVLGGGPIGSEIGQAMQRLGVEVTIIQSADRILPKDEPEVTQVLQDRLRKEGIELLLGRKAVSFRGDEKGVTAVLEGKDGAKQETGAERVLVAVGRTPNLEGLDLATAGVDHDKKGIKTDDHLMTGNPDIFAAGDVVGPYQFTHIASYHASVAVRNALFKRPAWQKVDYSNVPWTTFTDPEVAHLGLTEEQARERNGRVKVYTNEYSAVDRARTDGVMDGKIKVVTDKKGKILGAQIAGAQAGELLSSFIIAKNAGVALADIGQMIFPYPTLSEVVKKTAAKALIEKGENPIVQFLIKLLKR